MKGNLCVIVLFLPCFIFYLRAIFKYKPPGAYIGRGDLTEGFLCYEFGALTFGGAYCRNFTVCAGDLYGRFNGEPKAYFRNDLS